MGVVATGVVGDAGIEPATPSMSTKCSPTELIAPTPFYYAQIKNTSPLIFGLIFGLIFDGPSFMPVFLKMKIF